MGLVYWGLTPQQHPGLRVEGLRVEGVGVTIQKMWISTLWDSHCMKKVLN